MELIIQIVHEQFRQVAFHLFVWVHPGEPRPLLVHPTGSEARETAGSGASHLFPSFLDRLLWPTDEQW